MYFHKPQEKPRKWGSFQDVQYAVMKNCEKIYGVDPDSIVLAMPLFWGLSLLDFSGKNNHSTNHGAIYHPSGLSFEDSLDHIQGPNGGHILESIGTISFGYQKTNIPSSGYYYFFSLDDDYMEFSFYVGSINYFYVNTNAVNVTDIKDLITNGNHHNITVTWDAAANHRQVYVDGQKEINHTGAFTWDVAGVADHDLCVGGRKTGAGRFCGGVLSYFNISNVVLTADQIALFHDLPWALYQPVSRPVYFFQAVAEGISIPVAMQNMRGGFNPIGMRGGFINAD